MNSAATQLSSTAQPSSRPLRVFCYCDTDIVHSSDAVTGLIELADLGEIELQFRVTDRRLARPRGLFVLWLRVGGDEADSPGNGICIDCHDAPEYFCPDGMAACRLYYKSNLREETYAAVAPERHSKLRPFGPYLPCRPQRDRAMFRRWIGNLWTKMRHMACISTKRRSPVEKLRMLSGELRRHQRHASRKTWREYEGDSEAASICPPTILFNPSCWDESEAPSIRPMNEKRAQLITALRREFGERFVGGFRNYGPSVHRYPEAVEPRLVPHDEYVRLLHESPVTIYVNGKWGCYSWRLAENFAAGKCMVSERIPNDAGFPLDETAGIIQCDEVEEMVDALRRLCSSPERLRELAQHSRQAYVERMRPPVRMRRILAEVLATSGDDDRLGETAVADRAGAAS